MFCPLHRVLFNFAHFETLRKLKKGPNIRSGVSSLIGNVNLGLSNRFGALREAPSSWKRQPRCLFKTRTSGSLNVTPEPCSTIG
jgi:hypothetical protein